jgi:hypothetical protein
VARKRAENRDPGGTPVISARVLLLEASIATRGVESFAPPKIPLFDARRAANEALWAKEEETRQAESRRADRRVCDAEHLTKGRLAREQEPIDARSAITI